MLTMCKVAARGGGSQKQTCCNIKRNFNVADIIVWILIYLSVPCCVIMDVISNQVKKKPRTRHAPFQIVSNC